MISLGETEVFLHYDSRATWCSNPKLNEIQNFIYLHVSRIVHRPKYLQLRHRYAAGLACTSRNCRSSDAEVYREKKPAGKHISIFLIGWLVQKHFRGKIVDIASGLGFYVVTEIQPTLTNWTLVKCGLVELSGFARSNRRERFCPETITQSATSCTPPDIKMSANELEIKLRQKTI